jgi:hypothetical protein
MRVDWTRVGPIHLVAGGVLALVFLATHAAYDAIAVAASLLIWYVIARFGPPTKRPAAGPVAVHVAEIGNSLLGLVVVGRLYAAPMLAFELVGTVSVAVLTLWIYLRVARVPAGLLIVLHLLAMLSSAATLMRFMGHPGALSSLAVQALWRGVQVAILAMFIFHMSRTGARQAEAGRSTAEVFE